MARYGTVKYGATPNPAAPTAKYGHGGLSAAALIERDVLGGTAPWLPDRTIAYAEGCAQVLAIDPETWETIEALPDVGVGTRREARLVNWRYQQETLTVVLMDPDAYLPGGDRAAYVQPGSLLRVQWTVFNEHGTVTRPQGVYMVLSPPSRDDDAQGGNPLTVTAVDWLQGYLRYQVFPGGLVTYGDIDNYRTTASAQGFTPSDATPTFLTLLESVVWLLGKQFDPGRTPHLTVVPWDTPAWWFDPDNDTFGFAGISFPLTSPGTPATWYDVLDWLGRGASLRLTYATDGTPTLRDQFRRVSSGWSASCSSTVGDGVPLPWETLQRNLTDPTVTEVDYYFLGTQGGSAADASSGVPMTPDEAERFHGHAVSWSPVHPHVAGFTPSRQILERGTSQITLTFTDLNAYARWEVGTALADADQITLTLDSAFPVGELGVDVRVYDPPKADGTYTLVGVSQPLDASPQTWTLAWREGAL